jgi:regulator of cell morphogenesis and NO signaling
MGGFDPDAHWLSPNLEELVRYLRDMHSDQWRLSVSPVSEKLTPALLEYGDSRPELFELGRLFDRLRSQLVEHRAREEDTIFPALSQSKMTVDEMRAHFEEIRAAHRSIAAILDQMRKLTFHYSLSPADQDSPEVKELYAAMREMDGDVRRHMHVEEERLNEIVHPG